MYTTKLNKTRSKIVIRKIPTAEVQLKTKKLWYLKAIVREIGFNDNNLGVP